MYAKPSWRQQDQISNDFFLKFQIFAPPYVFLQIDGEFGYNHNEREEEIQQGQEAFIG